jgi:manganese/zinc/iron transport system substrate-binding protein
VRAEGHHVSIGGRLFSDTPGPEGTAEGTYLGMVIWNVTTVVTALEGDLGSSLSLELASDTPWDYPALVADAVDAATRELELSAP